MKQLLTLIVIAAIAFGGYSAYNGIFIMDAVVAKVVRGTAVKAVSGTITVEPEVETQLLSSGAGFIVGSELKEGMSFKNGDTLVRIESHDLPSSIASLEIEIKSLRDTIERGTDRAVMLDALKRRLKHSKELLQAGHTSTEKHTQLKEEVKVAEIALAEEVANLKTQLDIKIEAQGKLKEDHGRTTVRAKMDGVITKVLAYPGNLVGEGKALADIISNEMRITAEVNQDDISVIKVGGRADIRFFSHGHRLFAAKVREILPSTDTETQRFTIYLDIIEKPDSLLSGMTGEVSFFADERPNAILIPRQALLGNSVFVVNGGKVERREVQTGYLTYTNAEILKGLEEGDLVVAEDIDFFRDEDRVSISKIINE